MKKTQKNSKQKNITEETRTLGALLRLPYQVMAERMYTELAANGFHDIRPAHSSVFRHILPQGSRVTDMAEQAQMTKQSMAYLVDYLHTHGYVEYVPDPVDGRAKLVCLTQRGNKFIEAAITLSHRIEADLATQVGPANMTQLRNLLEHVIASLESPTRATDAEEKPQHTAKHINKLSI